MDELRILEDLIKAHGVDKVFPHATLIELEKQLDGILEAIDPHCEEH